MAVHYTDPITNKTESFPEKRRPRVIRRPPPPPQSAPIKEDNMSTTEQGAGSATAAFPAGETTSASNTSSTDTSKTMNNDTNNTSSANTTAGTTAGEAAKTGLLQVAIKYGKMLFKIVLSAAIIYFFGNAGINYGQDFLANGGVWTAVKAAICAGVALTEISEILAPATHFLNVHVWVPFKALFARKTADVAATAATAAEATAHNAEAAAAATAAAGV
jgi:hypothetical protein